MEKGDNGAMIKFLLALAYILGVILVIWFLNVNRVVSIFLVILLMILYAFARKKVNQMTKKYPLKK